MIKGFTIVDTITAIILTIVILGTAYWFYQILFGGYIEYGKYRQRLAATQKLERILLEDSFKSDSLSLEDEKVIFWNNSEIRSSYNFDERFIYFFDDSVAITTQPKLMKQGRGMVLFCQHLDNYEFVAMRQ